MNRRSFVKVSAAASAGIISSLSSCRTGAGIYEEQQLHNWAANISYSTRKVYYPSTVEQIRDIIRNNDKVKCLGSRHSFSKIADSNGSLISTEKMNAVLGLDKENKTVTVEPGIRYGELAVYLQKNGFALHNLASLPHISVAGACATATHGSGVTNGTLASAVQALQIVDGNGELHNITKEQGDLFNGSVVNLGALGVVTSVTLNVIPDYQVQQVVYKNLPFEQLKLQLHEIMSSGYSVSLFTNWSGPVVNQVWVKKVVDGTSQTPPPGDFHGAVASPTDLHPVEDQSAETVTTQRGIPGPWYERLPHFKMGFKPSTGKELQSEFFVSKENSLAALETIQSLGATIAPHLFISEIRSIKADDFWMSPAYKKDCIAIHTTWHQTRKVEEEMIPMFQEALAPYQPTPHWAKLSVPDKAALERSFPRIADFRDLCSRFDPARKFQNDYLHNFI
jgi:alditol oxidase